MPRKLTTEEFIEKARKIHGDKYNYSKVEYINVYTKVCIICPEHGEFWQIPHDHLKGHGCGKCGNAIIGDKLRASSDKFIKKASEIHNNKYDYSKVEYVNARTRVCVICPEHGEFFVTPTNHCSKSNQCGCPKCAGLNKLTTEEFIDKAKKIHGNKYNYSKVEYVNTQTKVCIICPEHGEFWQTPNSHLSGRGCLNCHKENQKFYKLSTTEEFIEKAKEIHGDKYDYSKVEYKGNKIKVCIVCPEHGEFWQIPSNHLRYRGCPKCKTSHLQLNVRNILIENNVTFEEEKILTFFRNGKSHLSVDFYLPDYNIAIECQGIQHYKPTNFGGKLNINEMANNYILQKERDNRKKILCEQNGIKILYIDWNEKDIKKIIKKIIDLN